MFWDTIWEAAGILGVHPGKWTLRQLILARDSRLEHQWWHTANLIAQQANIHRDKHSPKADPRKFNPFAKKTKPKAREATPEDLERLFGKDWAKYA
jgi:hypothetical protein